MTDRGGPLSPIAVDQHQHREQPGTDVEWTHGRRKIAEYRDLRLAQVEADEACQDAVFDIPAGLGGMLPLARHSRFLSWARNLFA